MPAALAIETVTVAGLADADAGKADNADEAAVECSDRLLELDNAGEAEPEAAPAGPMVKYGE